MTAHALKGDRERCLEAGMDGYTAKPINAEELFAAIETQVGTPVEAAARVDYPTSAGQASTAVEAAATADHPAAAGRAAPAVEAADAASSPAAAEAAIDWSEVLKTFRGDERLLRTIIETAIGEIPRLLEEIHRAAGAGDGHALRLAAHTLKGSVRYFGARHVLEPALRLEAMGQAGSLEGAGEVVAVLDQATGQLLATLAERMLTGNSVPTTEAPAATP
jgi:CheY-like chemotaxis protein